MGPKVTMKTHRAVWVVAQVDHLAPHVAVLSGSTVYWPIRLAMLTELFLAQLGCVQRGYERLSVVSADHVHVLYNVVSFC